MTGDPDQAWWEGVEPERPSEHFVLRLYITGSTPRSAKAIENIRRLCEERLKDRSEII